MQQKRNKKIRRRARRPAAARPSRATTVLGGGGQQTANAFVIRASGGRYEPRSDGKLQYAQKAIVALFPITLPKHINKSKLTRDVNARLKLDPDYHYGRLDRGTVVNALEVLLEANR